MSEQSLPDIVSSHPTGNDESMGAEENQSAGVTLSMRPRLDRGFITGLHYIGSKLIIHKNEKLGEGAQSTVYRGYFEKREVALKRILLEHFELAEKEVDYLRELDTHDHVVRWYDWETDHQFVYIALELCLGSLYQYVEDESMRETIPVLPRDIPRQATLGLAYLHSKNIVHRDLKPHNVMFSTRGETVRVVLSDFGLCKKQRIDRDSLSKSSGVRGSDGWIAPEALNCLSTSFPMDIFSLGCIFHYVLTGGTHPFGEPLHRNFNIDQGRFTLTLDSPEGHCLISRTLSPSPKDRPTAAAILHDPFFWSAREILDFFWDTSDMLERVVREDPNSPILTRLESDAARVVTENWFELLCVALKKDLSDKNGELAKMYNRGSVRSLLRVIRNKRNHPGHPSGDLIAVLGEIPNDFVPYFTGKFPYLLKHVHKALEWCSDERPFERYYTEEVRNRVKEEKAAVQVAMDCAPIEEKKDEDNGMFKYC